MDDVIIHLGYVAIFVGTFLEGESILALGGLAAEHGYLSFPVVVAVAVLGGFLGDQFFFFVGRRYGDRVLVRFPFVSAKVLRVQALLRRWDILAVILIRFLYGLRIAGPIVIGSCGIALWRLALFNFIGALIWAPLVAGIGYVAGQALGEWVGRLQQIEIFLVMAAVLAAVASWFVIKWRRRQTCKQTRPSALDAAMLQSNQISHLLDLDVWRSLRPLPQRHRSRWQSIFLPD